jgi:hypothetical protein
MALALAVVHGTLALPNALTAAVCVALTLATATAETAEPSGLAFGHNPTWINCHGASPVTIRLGLKVGLTLRRHDLYLYLSPLAQHRINARTHRRTGRLSCSTGLIGISGCHLGRTNPQIVCHSTAGVKDF